MFNSIDDLRSQLDPANRKRSPEYEAKMMHSIPEAEEVQRERFILERCAGKRVLEFGASGPLHEGLKRVATVTGVDKVQVDSATIIIDLDEPDYEGCLPIQWKGDIVLCAEILEHLGNPGHFLQYVRYFGRPVIITVPNAFTHVAGSHLASGYENVNREHVAWYSYRTLRTLIERYSFEMKEFYWYGGKGPTAQGLVMIVE